MDGPGQGDVAQQEPVELIHQDEGVDRSKFGLWQKLDTLEAFKVKIK